MCSEAMIHKTEAVRWDEKNNTVPQLHVARIYTVLLITLCAGTAALSFHYHYLLSIMALLLILNLLASGCGYTGLIKCVCVEDGKVRRATV